MNELQAKLARRRSLNGETEGKNQDSFETNEKSSIVENVEVSHRTLRGSSVRETSATLAIESKSATEELQKKLARRRNLNGELQKENSQDSVKDASSDPVQISFKHTAHLESGSRSASIEHRDSAQFSPERTESVEAQNAEVWPQGAIPVDLVTADQSFAEISRNEHPRTQVIEGIKFEETVVNEGKEIIEPSIHENSERVAEDVIEHDENHIEKETILVENLPPPPPIPSVLPLTSAEVEDYETNSVNIEMGVEEQRREGAEEKTVNPVHETKVEDHPSATAGTFNAQSPVATTALKKESGAGSIATGSKSATDELSKKLARRRNLNGEAPKEGVDATADFQHPEATSNTITQSVVADVQPVTKNQVVSGLTPSKLVKKTSVPPANTIPVAPVIPEKSFLNNPENDDELDLPFTTSKGNAKPKKAGGGKGIWDDDSVLTTLEEEDPLNFALPTNKEEVTKKLFKPKEPLKSVQFTPPAVTEQVPTLPIEPPEAKVEESEVMDDGEIEVDLSLPQLPKKITDATNEEKRSKLSSYPGKYVKERRLPWSRASNRIGSIASQQQMFNDFVSGIAERQSSMTSLDDDLGIGLQFENNRSLLEELEENNNNSDQSLSPPPVSSSSLSQSSQKRRVTVTAIPDINAASNFLKDLLEENDPLLEEVIAEETAASSTSLPKRSVPLPPLEEETVSSIEIPRELMKPRTDLLRRTNSVPTRPRKSAGLKIDTEDEEESGGLFDDLLSPEEKRRSVSTPSASTQIESLAFEDESSSSSTTKNNSTEDNLSILLGGSRSTVKYNPLEAGSQQSLIRSFANASARRSSAIGYEQKTIVDISGKGLIRQITESEDEESAEEETEQTQVKSKKSKDLFRESSSKNEEGDDGISLDTKKLKKGKEIPEEQIEFDEFIEKLKRCPELMEITNRFILSIKGPNGDGSPPTKFQRIDYKFYGVESIDERCRLFFEEMQNKLSKRAVFAGPDCEEWVISIRDCLEKYVMQQVGELAFSTVETKEEDAHLLRRMKLLSFLTPEVLEIKPELFNETLLKLAGDELRKINAFKAPYEKVECVIKCVTIIFRSLSLARVKQEAVENGNSDRGNPNLAGADDFLPLFIWVVLTSQIPSLFSNCEYIQTFLNPTRLMSKPGYCLINLRSAIEFVNYLEPSSLSIDPEYFQQQLELKEKELVS